MSYETKLKMAVMATTVIPSLTMPTLVFKWILFMWGHDLTYDTTENAVLASALIGIILAVAVVAAIEENWKSK